MCKECNNAAGLEEVVEAAKAAVLRGAAHFDEIAPSNWRELIDLDRLDITYPYLCVAGQVFKTAAAAELTSGYIYWEDNFRGGYGTSTSPKQLGLCPGQNEDGVRVDGSTLTEAWKDYLRAS